MKKYLFIALMFFSFSGISLATISSWTTNGERFVIYDSETHNSFVMSMSEIQSRQISNPTAYWNEVLNSAQWTQREFKENAIPISQRN